MLLNRRWQSAACRGVQWFRIQIQAAVTRGPLSRVLTQDLPRSGQELDPLEALTANRSINASLTSNSTEPTVSRGRLTATLI